MSTQNFIMTVIAAVALSTWSSCGDDGGGGSTSSSNTSSSMSSPMNLNSNRRKRRRKSTKKPANINLFANEKLSIPPFNEAAQNVPPELFSESGKDQRDPFRNFHLQDVTSSNTKESSSGTPNEDEGTILFEQFGLNELKLTGIIWSAGREKALFTSPGGQPTIVLKEDRISKSRALVKEITHDKVIVELRARNGQIGKMVTFSLTRTTGPYQIQYDKLRADQRGIRIRLNRWRSKRRRSHD